jgi:hypothetical protein
MIMKDLSSTVTFIKQIVHSGLPYAHFASTVPSWRICFNSPTVPYASHTVPWRQSVSTDWSLAGSGRIQLRTRPMRLTPLMCCPFWQVAETFAFGVDASGKAVAPPGAGHAPADPAGPASTTPLSELARLDTCVTVVDASNLLDNLHSLQTLKVCARVGSLDLAGCVIVAMATLQSQCLRVSRSIDPRGPKYYFLVSVPAFWGRFGQFQARLGLLMPELCY